MKALFSTFLLLIKFCSFSQDYLDIGKKYIENSKYDSANYFFDLGIKIHKPKNDTIYGYLTVYKGKSFQLQNDYDKAFTYYVKALTIFKNNNNINGEVYTYIVLGEFNRYFADYEKALKYLDLANDLAATKKISLSNQGYLYNRYAAVYNENGSSQKKVIQYSEKVISIAKQIDDIDMEASALREIGSIYDTNKDEKSLDYYFRALRIYQKVNNSKYIADMMFAIARCYYKFEKYEESIKYTDKGLAISLLNNWNRISRDLYFYKYHSLSSLKKYKEANIEMEHYFEFVYTVRRNEWDKEIKNVEIKFEVDKKNEQIKLQKLKTEKANKKAEEHLKNIKYTIIIIILLLLILTVSFYAYFKIKKSNQKLNKSINQKEILLQEVHHRVKNNLTVLNSLLYIQADESRNKETKRVLKECQGRIQSMALVHQNLYDVDDASEVKLNAFFNQLIDESGEIFGLSKIKLNKIISTNNINFDMSFTIFLGLIVNELITNSFKYAINELSVNEISIHLKKENEQFILTYSDSGNGMSDNFDLNKSTGFGFKLINILINQIRGTLSYSKKNNIFTIKFIKA